MFYNFTYRQKNGGFQVILSYKDSHGRWKQKSRQGFPTKAAAKIAGDSLLEDIKNNLPLYMEDNEITFGVFANNFIHDLDARESTIDVYKYALQYFLPIKDKKLSEVKYGDIERIISTIPVKASTANIYLGKIKTILSSAVQHELITKNPAAFVKGRKSENKKIHPLTKSRMEEILSLIKHKPRAYLACSIAAYTGMRAGEILGLTWNDVDFENSMIHVRHQHESRRLKTENSYRSVPMPNKLRDILVTYKRIGPLFSANKMHSLHCYLNNTLREYGITMHDFRHAYATTLLSKGFDLSTVAALLGDTVESVMRTYVHYNDDMRASAKERLLDFF